MKGQKKAARIQAKAITESAEKQAQQARFQAEANQKQSEQMILRQRAIDQSKALLEKQDVQNVNVSNDINETSNEVDPNTGRKRNAREAYRIGATRPSGINLI